MGVLSGDHCKAASDLGVPMVGVGLLYRSGYFRQTVDGDGYQQHFYPVYDFARLPREPRGLAHLVMVDRPPQATHGDFALDDRGFVRADGENRLTYSGIGVYRPQLFDGWRDIVATPAIVDGKPKFPLAPLLRAHMAQGGISGEHHRGHWTDVGTPQRLARLDAELAQSAPRT